MREKFETEDSACVHEEARIARFASLLEFLLLCTGHVGVFCAAY